MFKIQKHESIKEMFTRFTTLVNELNVLGERYATHQRIEKIRRSLPKILRQKDTSITEAKDLKNLAMNELTGSLKVHEEELMDELQLPKGKAITLKASQKVKAKHYFKALNSLTNFDAQNSDDELSEDKN